MAVRQCKFAYELAAVNSIGLMSLYILTTRVDNWMQRRLQTVVDLAVFAGPEAAEVYSRSDLRMWIMSTMCANLCTIVIPAGGVGCW